MGIFYKVRLVSQSEKTDGGWYNDLPSNLSSSPTKQNIDYIPAVLNFPANFTFSAVGKTNGDMNLRDEYAEEVKNVIKSISGGDEYCSTFEVVPRGSKFTKVLCVVEVQSATMINTIYEDIANLQKTVMRF